MKKHSECFKSFMGWPAVRTNAHWDFDLCSETTSRTWIYFNKPEI